MVQKGGNFNCNFQHSIDVFNSLNKVITRIKMNKNQHFTKPERLPGVINNPLRKTHSGMGNFWHAKKSPSQRKGLHLIYQNGDFSTVFNVEKLFIYNNFFCRRFYFFLNIYRFFFHFIFSFINRYHHFLRRS